MDKKIAIIVVVAIFVVLALLFVFGVFNNKKGRGDGSFKPKNLPGNYEEYANNSEVQALMIEMREAKMIGDIERTDEIKEELEALGVNMSSRGNRPDGFYPQNNN